MNVFETSRSGGDVRRSALFATFAAALLIVAAANTKSVCGHTAASFLPLQFLDYYAPFGFDETETYRDVWAADGYAYLGSLSSGVAIVDLSQPDSLSTAAVYGAMSGDAFGDVRVVDGVGYFSSAASGTHLVDLTTPTNPILLTQVSATMGGFGSVTNALVYNDQLFQISETSAEIAVYDVSDPASPSFVTRIDTNDSVGVYDLSAKDDRLYVAGLGGSAGEGAAYVYDIANLRVDGSASLLGVVATGANTASVAANFDHSQLLVSHREAGGTLAAWDISDLSSAIEIESIDASDLDVNAFAAGEIAVLDSTAYIAWHQAGVQVIDLNLLEQTDTIFRVGAFGTSQASPLEQFVGNTSVFPLSHDQVLLSDSRWGLYVVDATNVVVAVGDFNADGVVDASDIDFYSSSVGLTDQEFGYDIRLDFDADGTIELEDHNFHVNNHVETSNGATGALLGDVNLDGTVDVLGDASILIGSLNAPGPHRFATGDLNADRRVDVLGDAAILVGNLGQNTNPAASRPAAVAVPEPSGVVLLIAAAIGIGATRCRDKF